MKIQRFEADEHRLLCHDFYSGREYEGTRTVALFDNDLICAGVAVVLNDSLAESECLGPALSATQKGVEQ
jgi:hypothetical protein